MIVDINKQYRTRDGREARVYATDGVGGYCVHGAYKGFYGWHDANWMINGKFANGSSNFDLVEVKPGIKRTYWVNVYDGDMCGVFTAKNIADSCVRGRRLACVKIKIDCEEGEGL